MNQLARILSLVVVWSVAAPADAADLREPLPAALLKVKAGEAVIVDVREADELKKEGIVEQAVWLATSEIKAKSPRYEAILKALPKDRPIYTYCAVGGRAEAFAEALDEQGYVAAGLGGLPELVVAGFTTKPIPDVTSQPCPYLCQMPSTPVPTPAPATPPPAK